MFKRKYFEYPNMGTRNKGRKLDRNIDSDSRKQSEYPNMGTRNKGRKLDRNIDSDSSILLRINLLEEMVRKLAVENEHLKMEVEKLKLQDNEYFNYYIS